MFYLAEERRGNGRGRGVGRTRENVIVSLRQRISFYLQRRKGTFGRFTKLNIKGPEFLIETL